MLVSASHSMRPGDGVWRFAGPVAFSLAFIILFSPRLVWMVDLWTHNGVYSFCFAIPFVSAFLAWKRRRRISEEPGSPSPYGLALVFAGVLAVVLLDWSGFRLYSLTPVFMVVILAGAVWGLYGFSAVRLLAFPLLFLLLLVPIPPWLISTIDYPLQELCARFTTRAVQFAGIPAHRVGATVYFSKMNFSMLVAPACNGLRSSLPMLALAVVYDYLSEGPLAGKVLLVAAALPLAYLGNFVRLFLDVIIGNALGTGFIPYEQVYDLLSGFFIFLLACLLLFAVAGLVKCTKLRPIS